MLYWIANRSSVATVFWTVVFSIGPGFFHGYDRAVSWLAIGSQRLAYRQELDNAIDRLQPKGERDAFADFVKGAEEFDSAIKSAQAEFAMAEAPKSWPEAAKWPEGLNLWHDQLSSESIEAQRRYIEAVTARRGMAALESLTGNEAIRVPTDSVGLTLNQPWLAPARAYIRLQIIAGRFAAQEDDWPRAIHSFNNAMKMCSLVERSSTTLASLVGMASRAHVALAMLDACSQHSRLPREVARELLAIFEQSRPLPIRETLNIERLTQLQFARSVFVPIGSQGPMLFSPRALDATGGSTTVALRSTSARDRAAFVGTNVYLRLGIDLTETERMIDREMIRLANDTTDAGSRGWSAELQVKREGLAAVRAGFIPQITLPASSRIVRSFNWIDRQRDATMLALAVRLFSATHGRLPSTVDELVPAILDAIPPSVSSGRIKLLKEITQTGPEIVIYSIGPDGIDNGSRSDPDARTDMDLGDGFDFVFARIRP